MSEKSLKKKPSGHEYRKRKLEKQQEFEKSKKCMGLEKYITRKQAETPQEDETVASVASTSEVTISAGHLEDEMLQCLQRSNEDLPEDFDEPVDKPPIRTEDQDESNEISEILTTDIGLWQPTLNRKTIDHLIVVGPNQNVLKTYPDNIAGRHFSSTYFYRNLENGETILRRWLVYSVSKDCIFCFCCRLFNSKVKSIFVSQGYDDWKHIVDALKIHEHSTSHTICYQQWLETEMRIKKCETIDKQELKLIEKEKMRWHNVLLRLLNIILYLAENNMAFRGTSDRLYEPNNGKFLGLVQLIAKFEPVMQEHLKLAIQGDISDHYCGKNIQNELIQLMAEKVTYEIVSRAKKAKYFSIIADCTPDISHIEQMSFTIRFVDSSDGSVTIKEHFLEFHPAGDSSGSGLTAVIIDILKKHGLELNNCRGQGYDNGANMKGKNSGVQRRILDLNPLAFFVPCGCHSYNLVLSDAAKSSVKSVTLFGILQRLFTLFSPSVNRWKILTDHLKNYTIKRLSDTRWEARITSVKAVRYQLRDVHEALITLASTAQSMEPGIAHEAMTLAEQLEDFSFIVSLVVWYDVLFQINVVSKVLQGRGADITACSVLLRNCTTFLENYRKTGFKTAIITAKELAEELQVEPVFKPLKRIRHVKRRFDDSSADEPIESPEKKLEVEFFNALLDTSLLSVKERFEQFNQFSETWGFLYNLNNISSNKQELIQHCADLQRKLTNESRSDIDGTLLCDELISIKSFLSNNLNITPTPISVLNFIQKHKVEDLYPNVWIAMRILLTIPVTVASGERSFSKLKLIKTYLRSTMSQSRLTALANLSIENEIAEHLNFSELLKQFADKKARKVKFS